MGVCQYFLCFALFSFIGWLYECVYYSIQQRKPVNSGFLSTCFCPIYGIGALLVLAVLGEIENTAVIFMAGMALTCTLEYIVSWLLEKLFRKRWWDYTNWPANINGRICLLGGIVFGIMSVVLVKALAPLAFGFIAGLSTPALQITTAFVALVMLADTVHSVRSMNSEKLWYVEKQSEIFAGADGSDIMDRVKHIFRK